MKLLERYKIRKKAKYIPESKLVNCVQSYACKRAEIVCDIQDL